MTRVKDVIVVLGPAAMQGDRAALSIALHRLRVRPWALCSDWISMRYALAAGIEAGWLEDAQDMARTFDVALVGAVDDMAAAMLAEAQGAALVFDVLDVVMTDRGLQVTRDLGRGAKDVLSIEGPAVLGVSDEAENRLYISRHRRRSVENLPRRQRPDPEEGPEVWQLASPRTRTADIEARTGGTATSRAWAIFGVDQTDTAEEDGDRIVRADADTCANHLIRYLAHHGFIDRQHTAPVTSKPIPPPSESDPLARSRRPRPVSGHTRSMARPPFPVAADPSERAIGKLVRRPRPAGQLGPIRVRGPFPVRS